MTNLIIFKILTINKNKLHKNNKIPHLNFKKYNIKNNKQNITPNFHNYNTKTPNTKTLKTYLTTQ